MDINLDDLYFPTEEEIKEALQILSRIWKKEY